MILGKVGKFYKENCLVDQAFVKDDKQSVAQHTPLRWAKSWAARSRSSSSCAMRKGEGLEKRVDDFASEVAGMVK